MTKESLRALVLTCCMCLLAQPIHAEISDGVVRIGVLTDLSGIFADMAGPGSVIAVKMAVDEFGGAINGRPIEVLQADHHNNPDIGIGIARKWYDGGVDAILDMGNSTVAAGVNALSRERKKVAIISSAGSSFLTGKDCSPYALDWTYNSRAIAFSTVKGLSEARSGSWYFLTLDYSFGIAAEADAIAALKSVGGTIAGSVRHPLNTTDFAQYLLQAAATNPDVIAFANAGGDTVNGIKQAREFGIVKGDKPILVPLVMQITDVHAMGLQLAQGLVFTEGFYWDRTDAARAWSKRFFALHGAMPTMNQAGLYSATMHYLQAIKKTDSDDAEIVVPAMREAPVNDIFAQEGRIRPDGQLNHDFYLVQVKTPAESTGPWDLYTIKATVPGKDVFAPIEQSACPFLRH